MAEAAPDTIRILVRQAARWSTAAQQDANPLVAALHANYGYAFAAALRQIANDEQIRRVAGIDAAALEDEISRIQDAATARLAAACPAIVPQGRLTAIARESLAGRANLLAAAR